jgi:FkbM family methyltransferase
MSLYFRIAQLVLQNNRYVEIEGVLRALGDSFLGKILGSYNLAASSQPPDSKGSIAVGDSSNCICALIDSPDGSRWMHQKHIHLNVRCLTQREISVISSQLSMVNHPIELSAFRYGLICAFHADTVIGRSLRVYGEWAQNEIDFLCSLISHGDVVLDCGSFIGTHSVPFMKAVGPSGLLIAIEASQIAFLISLFNIMLNTDNPALFLINAYASKFCGQAVAPSYPAEAECNPGAMTYNSLDQDLTTDELSTQSSVATLAIDALFLERLDVVKLDVEGAEISVLKGMEGTIKKFRPTIWAEVLHLSSLLELIEWSRAFQYHAYGYVIDAYNPDNYNGLDFDIWAGGRELSCLLIDPSSKPVHFEIAKSTGKLVSLLDLEHMMRFFCQKTQYVSCGPVYSDCSIF